MKHTASLEQSSILISTFPNLSAEITLQEAVAAWEQQKQKSVHRGLNTPFRVIGNVLLGIAVFGMVFFGSPFLALELRSAVYRITQPLLPVAYRTTDLQQESLSQTIVSDTQTEITPPTDQQFRIRIPMIGVDSNVTANVDMNAEKEYLEVLKHGVAHAKGTGLPGENSSSNKTIFIFAHSTNGSWNIARYNALFYSIKDMNEGDRIQIWFWGKEYWYKVVEKRIVSADDTASLEPQTEKEQLILQTCWPPGTTMKRLFVIAERVEGN